MSHTAQDWPIGAAVLPFPNIQGPNIQGPNIQGPNIEGPNIEGGASGPDPEGIRP
ncbi:hypothetical protein ACIOGX_16310 [Streptomyces sp. NPDC088147]|uniref:hypothetical protein n=1 Tax=Streptomyces sp. NPDC088147 TaxID=3365830 RepID=UPI003825A9F8